jgi:hypothetical protein
MRWEKRLVLGQDHGFERDAKKWSPVFCATRSKSLELIVI